MDNNELPTLSVVLLVPDDSNSNDRTLARLRSQTIADQLEIVFVATPNASVNESWVDGNFFKSVVMVRVDSMESTAAARAVGIRAASAKIVAFGEDHSFPEPGWAESLIEAHRGPWAVVGPAVANGNPRYALSWANLAIEYGDWIDPATSRPVDHLPGHNSSYKREILLNYGDDLEQILEAETILHWDLRSKGHRLYLNAGTRTFHLNYSLLGWALVLRFLGGRHFATARSRTWPLSKRLFYAVCSPLIPLRRGRRAVHNLIRIGQFWHFLPQMLVLLPVLLATDAFGEMWGYLFGSGTGRAMARLSEIEFKRERFMKKDDYPLTTRQSEPAALSVQ